MAAPADVTEGLRAIGPEHVCGAWELISIRRTSLSTGAVSAPFGQAPRGYLTYMPRWTDTWRIDGRRIRHRVDVSWNESWTGTEVVRLSGIDEAGRLVLSTGPTPAIVDGSFGVAVLTWRRAD